MTDKQLNDTVFSQAEHEQTTELTNFLTSEPAVELVPYLSVTDISRLMATCQHLYQFFKQPLSEMKIKALVEHVVNGRERAASNMIANYPDLVLISCPFTVKDHAGHLFKNVSPWEAAIITHDDQMLKIMLPALDHLKNGIDIALEQFTQLRSSLEDLPKDNINFTALIHVISNETLIDDKISATTQAELDAFRNRFSENNHISFHVHSLIAALQHYKKINRYWNDQQCSLFFRQVIGFTQRYLPTWLAQVFCNGLFTTCQAIEDGKALNRRLQLQDGSYYFSFTTKKGTGLGFDTSISAIGTTVSDQGDLAIKWLLSTIKALFDLKQASFDEIRKTLENKLESDRPLKVRKLA